MVKLSHRIETRAEAGARRKAAVAAVAAGLGSKINTRDSSVFVELTDDRTEWNYVPPAIANPGCLIKTTTGGGYRVGWDGAHENVEPSFPADFGQNGSSGRCAHQAALLSTHSADRALRPAWLMRTAETG